MDMLNDMFQRQARRLESQLYQRAQDLRTIELTQRQAAHLRAQVRQLEQGHLEQAARISQGAKSLQRLQELIRESILSNTAALGLCEALEHDAGAMRQALQAEMPSVLQGFALRCDECPTVEQLRDRAAALESALAETERSAIQQIGVTPLTSVAMSSDCNPLHDLSAVADYASKAAVSAQQQQNGDTSSITRSSSEFSFTACSGNASGPAAAPSMASQAAALDDMAAAAAAAMPAPTPAPSDVPMPSSSLSGGGGASGPTPMVMSPATGPQPSSASMSLASIGATALSHAGMNGGGMSALGGGGIGAMGAMSAVGGSGMNGGGLGSPLVPRAASFPAYHQHLAQSMAGGALGGGSVVGGCLGGGGSGMGMAVGGMSGGGGGGGGFGLGGSSPVASALGGGHNLGGAHALSAAAALAGGGLGCGMNGMNGMNGSAPRPIN